MKNMIIFDILYNKKLEKDSIKLSEESEFQQLKIMISGKYKILDMSKLFIYFKDKILYSDDSKKLKDIFRKKHVKLEISNKQLIKQSKEENIKYYCECKTEAFYICEKCQKFLCKICLKKEKHLSHTKQVIKITEYSTHFKKIIRNLAAELDNNIINEEAYRFLKYWDYDKKREIKIINNLFEFLKKELEDIKQIEIDFILNMSSNNTYNILQKEINQAFNEYENIDADSENIESIINKKNKLIEDGKEILDKYNELKNKLLNYVKAIKDIQSINKIIQKLVEDNFSLIKKQFLNNSNSYNKILKLNNNNSINQFSNKYQTLKNTNFSSLSLELSDNNLKTSSPNIIRKKNNQVNEKHPSKVRQLLLNKSPKYNKYSPLNTETNLDSKYSNNFFVPRTTANNFILSLGKNEKNNKKPNTKSVDSTLNSLINSHKNIDEHLLFKIKDKVKIFIFSFETQNFKENVFIDKSDFKKDYNSISDIIQLNVNNVLYLISGKNHNKFYYYDYQTNTMNFLNNTLFSHYLGSLVYCCKNKKIYLIGGNNQLNCEVININNSDNEIPKWEKIAKLNEERQEFASMYYNDYIYVFFGFSYINGCNLSSIERININDCKKFEVIYINEKLKLSSLSCAKYYNEFNKGGILLLGGFDGESYIDSSLVFFPEKMRIKKCELVIPNLNKHFQFLFQTESNFIEIDNNSQIIFDMKNNIHLLTRDSYVLFSKI